jgi:hypothetical protein
MSAETSDATLWPYALNLICADGPREFRFRVDLVEPEKSFGRGGNSLRAGNLPPIAGMIVAEKLNPWTTGGTGPGFWSLPSFREVQALAAAAEPGLGLLRANRSTFTMPSRDEDPGPLEVSEVQWLRWNGEDFAGREIERPILFADEPEGDAVLGSKIRLSEKIWMKLVADKRRTEELLGRAVQMIDAGISIDSSFAWVEMARPFARFREAPRQAIELPTDDPPEWVGEPAEDEPIPDVPPAAEGVEEAPDIGEFNELEQAERDEETRIEEEESARSWRFGGYA